jgi:ferredoxin-type protein NapG
MKDPSTSGGGEGQAPGPEGPGGIHRRDFVREGFRNLFRPIAKVVGDRIQRIRVPPEVFSDIEDRSGSPAPTGGEKVSRDPSLEGRILRPPGAIAEARFLERCDRSGKCVAACPVGAIRVLRSEDRRLDGTPHIEPRLQACIVCEDLSCMKACPSGALTVVPRNRIEIGVAEVRYDRCLRSVGDECQVCVDRCPLHRQAIEIPYFGARVEVKADGCVGCGVCEMHCPTDPRSIVVRPRG